MAGIYVHIPYCKTKCNYCDFYSLTNKQNEAEFVSAVLHEIKLQQHFFASNERIESIYFGGGTPSFLKDSNIQRILLGVFRAFKVSESAEISLEANPNDLTRKKLANYRNYGFNRLSIGVQSVLDKQLAFMQRRHTVIEAFKAVNEAVKMGFTNLSIDLIYGLPKMSANEWEKSLDEVLKWPIKHISAYHLTIEAGTPLFQELQRGKVHKIKDKLSYQQFEILMNKTAEQGFEQYEISNFAKDKSYSRHNSSYWQNKAYLGLGPAAHSYNLKARFWNLSNLNKYIEALARNTLAQESEILSDLDIFNDAIITRLRTSEGIALNKLFSLVKYKTTVKKMLDKHLRNNYLEIKGENVKLTRNGIHVSDRIMADLMIIE